MDIAGNRPAELNNIYWGVRCNGKVVHGPRAGQQCKKDSIKGGTLCKSHGGTSSKHLTGAINTLIELRKQMLEELAPKAVKNIRDILDDDEMDPRIKLSASTAVLDRVGMGPQSKLEHSGEVGVEVSPGDELLRRLDDLRDRAANPLGIEDAETVDED